MKKLLFKFRYPAIVMLMLLAMPAHGDEPITFQQYRALSPEARQKVVAEANPELKQKYDNWDQILSAGGLSWKPWQATELVDLKGFNGLFTLAIEKQNLWGYYFSQTVAANKKSGMTPQAQNTAERSLEAEYHAVEKELDMDVDLYLVKLAPSPEAIALNEKAANIAADWHKRFPLDGIHKITREDLKALDAAVKEIRDEMKKLPQLTPEQIEDEISTLPDEPPHKTNL